MAQHSSEQILPGFNHVQKDLDTPTLKIGQRHFELYSYGLRTEKSGLSVMAEYATTKDLDDQKYQDLSKETLNQAIAQLGQGHKEEGESLLTQALIYSFHFGGSKGYYVTTGYQFSSFATYLTYASLVKAPAEKAREDQTSTALGVNLEPSDSSVIKLEAKRIKVPNESRGLFKDPSLEERKGLNGTMIFSINYNVIF